MMIWETQVAAGTTTAVKPIRQPYPAPNIKARPRKPYLLTEINTSQIASSIKIEGLTQTATSAVKVELVYEGFERGIPQMKQTGVAPNIKYYYEATYRHPVTLKIDVPGRGLVINERVPGCEGYRSARTPEYKTQAEVEMYWLENQKAFWDDKQTKAPSETVAEINSYLTEKVGYPVKSRNTEIRTVKSKEHDHTDLLTAFTNFQDGVLQLQYKDKKSAAQDKLEAAITIWEKALTESNLNDKNARIDKNVTSAIYVNVMEAYLWMNDFANAEIYGNKAISMDNKYGRDAKGRMPMVQFQKDRYMANE
jgi:tetratricopeptide (TPR) repeat protein